MKCATCGYWSKDITDKRGRRRCLLAAPLADEDDAACVAMTGDHDGCSKGKQDEQE